MSKTSRSAKTPSSPAKKRSANRTAARTPRKEAKATSRRHGAKPDRSAGRIEALTQVFAALGAQDPAFWAESQVKHGVDEIGRFVLMRALWLQAIANAGFLDKARERPGPLKSIVDRLLAKGASRADLALLVYEMQARLLENICGALDDPSDNDEGIAWGVWRMDRMGLPLWQLGELARDIRRVEPGRT